jgi:hypothetical protein
MREYVKENYVCDARVQTVSMILLLHHTEFAMGAAELMKLKCLGITEGLDEMAEEFYESFGRHEAEIERYYDHYLAVYSWRNRVAKGKRKNIFNF